MNPQQLQEMAYRDPVTSSVGIASITSETISTESLIEYADSALYATKKSGRNIATKWTTTLLS